MLVSFFDGIWKDWKVLDLSRKYSLFFSYARHKGTTEWKADSVKASGYVVYMCQQGSLIVYYKPTTSLKAAPVGNLHYSVQSFMS